MKTVLNLEAVDTLRQPIFFGRDLSLQRYDKFKYPIFFDLYKKQIEFFWWPHEINLSKDKGSYLNLTDVERFVFDTNLQFQTLGDSMLSRSIHNLAKFVSIPEMEACMNVWAHMETIHSYSYSYVLANAHPDASKFFDGIMENKEILSRAHLIRDSFDKILGDPKDSPEDVLDCIVSVNIMEGLVFYISFACSFFFGEEGKMVGNANIIKLINRDENLHVAITQDLLKILQTERSEGFVDLWKRSKDKYTALFEKIVKEEKGWAEYLFSKGHLLGLNERVLHGYVEFLANRRMEAIGLKPIFESKTNPIGGWLKNWVDSQAVQVAPQETEIISYKAKASVSDMDGADFGDLKL